MDLRNINNSNCLKDCDKIQRRKITDDDICNIAISQLDGLSTRCVGNWAYDKIYRLNNYFDIFAKGMKDKWSGLNYLEICSGPGRCIIRETQEEIDGTSLSILRHPSYSFIQKAIFVDNNPHVTKVLNKRISDLGIDNAEAMIGDYNDINSLNQILRKFDSGYLNLVFIDPTDCSVPFSIIKAIKRKLKKVDFIMIFPYGTDLKRNLRKAIINSEYLCRNKYSEFLGDVTYFENPELQNLESSSINENVLFQHFFTAYKKQLSNNGLKYFDSELVKTYYMLVFASGDEKGLDFWKRSQKISPNDQREFDFS